MVAGLDCKPFNGWCPEWVGGLVAGGKVGGGRQGRPASGRLSAFWSSEGKGR